MTDRLNAPLPEPELRERVREIADAVLIAAVVASVAALREAELIALESAEIVIDEWSSACHEKGQFTRESLEEMRAGGGQRVSDELSAHVEQLIEERRIGLRMPDDDPDEHTG